MHGRSRACKDAGVAECTDRDDSADPEVFPARRGGSGAAAGDDGGSADVTNIFETAPRTVPRARHTVMATLIDAGMGIGTIETAALLTTELASNAVLHSVSSSYTVDVDVDLTRVHVEVGDGDDRYPLRPLREPLDTDHGRGLQLVDSLAARWGVRSGDVGKVVWFELPVDP